MATIGAAARHEIELLSALCSSFGFARAHPLPGEVIKVGRDPSNDVVLIDGSVSAMHAELSWNAGIGQWVLSDLHSRNGTIANGEVVVNPVPLTSGAHMLFGETYVVLHTEAVYQRTLEVATRTIARGL